MSVEWLRSCYESEWHLFRDDLSQVTRGEYYFSPPDTPFYPGWHRLGARVWHDANWTHAQTLGESLTAKQEWDDGDVPNARVNNVATGSADCLENGELLTDGLPSGELPYGFPPACFASTNEGNTLWETVRDYENCQVQKVYAFLVQALYELDDDAIVKTVRDWLGALPVITIHHHAGPRPGLITIRYADWMIGVIDGTWEFQEAALQAFAFIVGPTNKGSFSTAGLWWDSSTYLNNLLNDDGQMANGRLMLVGHSYGGACALVSAARYKLWAPSREIVYLTFGVPKIGDMRFVDIVRTLEGLNLAHQLDIVTSLPPDKITLAPVQVLFPLAPLFLYTEWFRPYPQAMIRLDGSLDYQQYPAMDTATLAGLVGQAILHLDLNVIEAHKMPRYIQLLQTRCPEAHWPIDEQVNFDIHLNDEAMVWSEPKRPRSSIVWNSPHPRVGCAAAILLAVGQSYTYPSTPFAVFRWVKIAVEPGIEYRITTTILDGASQNSFRRGPDCDHLTVIANFVNIFDVQCRSHVAGDDGFFWLQAETLGPELLTVQFDIGACP